MKIEIELNAEILHAFRVNMQELALDGEPPIPLEQWAVECIQPMAKCIIEDNILDAAGNIYAKRSEINDEAMEVARHGGDFQSTYQAMIAAAKACAQSTTP